MQIAYTSLKKGLLVHKFALLQSFLRKGYVKLNTSVNVSTIFLLGAQKHIQNVDPGYNTDFE